MAVFGAGFETAKLSDGSARGPATNANKAASNKQKDGSQLEGLLCPLQLHRPGNRTLAIAHTPDNRMRGEQNIAKQHVGEPGEGMAG